MTRLCNATLPQIAIPKPTYDRSQITNGIVHIGVGGFHRAHQAVYLNDLMQQGKAREWGICGVGLLPQDKKMAEALGPQDELYTVITRDAEGDEAQVIGSLTRYLLASEDREGVLAALTDPATRIVTMTITEGGYNIDDPARPAPAFEFLTNALRRRRDAGTPPFTVLSCDNVQGNGHAARHALTTYAGRKDAALGEWIEQNVKFPNCMVDRITPQTTDADRKLARDEFSIDDAWPVVCEPFRQWVVEDEFSNGRPPLEDVGVQFVPDVRPYEKMKLRLLNAGHSALGYPGALAGYAFIDDVASGPLFQRLLRGLWTEVLPLLDPVPGIHLAEYQNTLLVRFANPRIKDQVARICLDGSAKMPRFILPSVEENLQRGFPPPLLTLVVAAWIRYLQGQDDAGKPIVVEDPMAASLMQKAKEGGMDPRPLLSLRDIFGGLGDSQDFVAALSDDLMQLEREGLRVMLASHLDL